MALESGRYNTSSPSVFSVVEMGSLLQVYATTGLNLPRKFMNTKGCRISFHCIVAASHSSKSKTKKRKRKMLET